jgi:cold shock CspA family protein
MKTGTVLKVFADKNYGFLRDGEGDARFFHRTAFQVASQFGLLREGTRVVFEPADHPRGPRAVNLRLAGE